MRILSSDIAGSASTTVYKKVITKGELTICRSEGRFSFVFDLTEINDSESDDHLVEVSDMACAVEELSPGVDADDGEACMYRVARYLRDNPLEALAALALGVAPGEIRQECSLASL